MKIIEREKLTREVIIGSFLGVVFGSILSWFLKSSLDMAILLISFFMMGGFFVTSFIHFYKLGKEKSERYLDLKNFDWGVEINLKKIQINYDKSASMLQFAGFLAGGIFAGMAFIVRDYPSWSLGHEIFFPLSSFLFICFLHFAFRWWFNIRAYYRYLKFKEEK